MRYSKIYANIDFNPNNPEHLEENREFQCGPSIGVTKKGRLFFTWEAGGYMEPCADQYLLLRYSDDFGKTLSKEILEINFNKKYNIHCSDMVPWVDPCGKLHLFWTQEDATPYEVGRVPKYFYNSKGQRWCAVDGLLFKDFTRCTWEIICENPDEDNFIWSEPRCLFDGNMINPPIVTKTGRWLYPAYICDGENISYYISDDKGKTLALKTGGKMLKTQCAETTFYEGNEGEIVFLQRAYGKLGKAISYNNGDSFGDVVETEILNCNTQATSLKLSNGHILLCNNDHETDRKNMTVYLSCDNGKIWKKKLLDTRATSNPTMVEYEGVIYTVFDHDRLVEREILFVKFTEDDIINDNEIEVISLSKPICPISPYLHAWCESASNFILED